VQTRRRVALAITSSLEGAVKAQFDRFEFTPLKK
jgi:hypothetical protein